MELDKIERLLERYDAGETTSQEESLLRDYFLTNEVPPHLKSYQTMFLYFNTSKKETYNKTIDLKPKKTTKVNFKWLSIAASILLLLGVFVGKTEYDKYQQRKQFAQVTEALKAISVNLKKGNDAFENLYTYEDTVNKIFKNK